MKIIDDEYKVKPLTKQDIEALGYACGEIKKCFTNGWNKSLENKPFKEDKKIEKLEGYDFDENLSSNDKCECLRERMLEIENKLDEIIDYLMEDNK